MKRVWSFYYENNKGFTLLELIMTISIISIVMINVVQILLFANKSIYSNKTRDNNMGEINRTLEYIEYEIKKSDSTELLKDQSGFLDFSKRYPDNIGFLIKIKEKDANLYITYCLDGNKLRRMSCRRNTEILSNLNLLEGYNLLSENIYGLRNTEYNEEEMYINLRLNSDYNGESKQYNKIINLLNSR